MHKVLVIDDNDTLHELFRCYAMLGDVKLSHAVSLDEAIAHLGEVSTDLLLLDNRLQPFNDYTETVPLIREAGYKGKIAVISSELRAPVFSKYKEHNVDAVFDKFDFTLQNFTETVSRLV